MALRYSLNFLFKTKTILPKRPFLQPDIFSRLKELDILKPLRGKGKRVSNFAKPNAIAVRLTNRITAQHSNWNRPRKLNNDISPGSNINTDLSHSSWIEPPVSTNNRISTVRNKIYCQHKLQNGVNKNNLISIEICKEKKPSAIFSVMNCQSVKSKPEYIKDFIVEKDVDCVALTETWLTGTDADKPTESQLVPNGYKLLHVPRLRSRGGGVGVIYKQQYPLKTDPAFAATSFESMNVLATIGSSAFRIIVLYRVPPSKQNKLKQSTFLEEFADLLEQAATWTGKLIIMGDFNVHWNSEDNHERKDLASLLEAFSITQHVCGPTHSKGHTLDLVMTRTENNIVRECITSDFISDHNAILVTLNTGKDHPPRKYIETRKLRDIQFASLDDDIASSVLSTALPDDVDDAVESYNTVLTELLNKHAPLKTHHVVDRVIQPWMNEEILHLKRQKRRSERQWRKCHLTVHRLQYRADCLAVKNAISKAKSAHYLKKIENCEGDQKKLFAIVDSLLGRGKSNSLPSNQSPLSLAESFNEFFINKITAIRTALHQMESTISSLSFDLDTRMSPSIGKLDSFTLCSVEEIEKLLKKSSHASCHLDPIPTHILCELPSLIPIITDIVNKSLSTGLFPSCLKSAVVKPLLKKASLNPDIFKNYRPVSNLSFLSKVIEKAIASRLISHMKENGQLDKMQSAYKSSHSTETALLRVQNDILRAVDQGNAVLLVLLDLSAAFDTVDHCILLSFLRDQIGLTGSALHIFETYLEGRTQCISISNVLSTVSKLIFGVPQGSVLGPIIFCTYTLPLGKILQYHNIPYHIYADDTQLYCTSPIDSTKETLSLMEACVKDIRSWMVQNKLKINDDKTEFLILSSPRTSVDRNTNLTIGTSEITQSKSCRNLGVMFDSHIKMDVHINSVCRSTHFHLRNIGAIRHHLTDSAAAQLVHALVTSRLDYCNSLLYGLPDTMIYRLQRIQNIACRIVCRAPKETHVTPLLKDLHWLQIRDRITFKILLLAYRALNNLAPEYISELIHLHQPVKDLRSGNLLQLAVPTTRLKTFGDRSFEAAAPKEWNKLPIDIKLSSSIVAFKSNVKTHLFRLCYKK